METVIIGHLSTANFDFYFVADSYINLLREAENAWNLHKAKTGALWKWEDIQEDLFMKEMSINSGHKR